MSALRTSGGALAALALTAALAAAPATARIPAPTIAAGPSNTILSIDGTALAPDGTGGILYTGVQDGVTHLYAVSLRNGTYGTPVQVDTFDPYGASQPAIAAANGGELLVVWVQPYAVSPSGVTRYALESAVMDAGSKSFSSPIMVDNSVGEPYEGSVSGVDPQLAMAPSGAAYVTYRVVTDDCNELYDQTNPLNAECPSTETVSSDSPSKVVMSTDVAEWNQGPWTALGAVNKNPDLADAAPTAANAPQIAASVPGNNSGNAVAVWQEPDSSGYARIWARRIYGAVLGPAMQLSPNMLGGKPVDVDADAPALTFSQSAEAAFRLAAGAPSAASGANGATNAAPQLLALSVPTVGGNPDNSTFTELASGANAGPPSVASDTGGPLAITDTNGQVSLSQVGSSPVTIGFANPGSQAFTAADPSGGAVSAWQSADANGLPQVDVVQSLLGGRTQSGSLVGPLPGPISGLSLSSDPYGDALIAWMQGSPGNAELVADNVTAPPQPFPVTPPDGWVAPDKAIVTWQPAPDAGTVTYDVFVDGNLVATGIPGPTSVQPTTDPTVGTEPAPPNGESEDTTVSYNLAGLGLGTGSHTVTVIGVDAGGQEVSESPATVQLDATPPVAQLQYVDARHGIRVSVTDADSGVDASATRIAFGDGTTSKGKATITHDYQQTGRYVLTVTARDQAGNATTDHLWVTVS